MLLETDVPFEMKINFDKGLISGVRTDDESSEVFDRSKPIRVTGEANGKHIKFVVMYPGRYYANEFCELTVDYNDKYPGCNYVGEWQESEQKYVGEWEIDINQAKLSNSSTDVVYAKGTWEMWRKPSPSVREGAQLPLGLSASLHLSKT